MFALRIAAAVLLGAILDTTLLHGEPDHWSWNLILAILFGGGFLLSLGLSGRFWQVGVAMAVGAMASHALTIARDWTRDPTSHNLFPFEFAILGAIHVFAFAGCGAAALLHRLTARKLNG
jgi:hypothetical protein